MTGFIDVLVRRDLLARYFGNDPRVLAAFEDQALTVQANSEALESTVAATTNLQDASVVTLSANEALTNEFRLVPGDGTELEVTAGLLKINCDDSVVRCEGGAVRLMAPAPVTLFLPVEGELLSNTFPATVYNKVLDKPKLQGLANAASDAAASAAGVPVGGVYHNAGVLRVRLA
ncbi:MAG: hypothetical protein DMF06_05310 [Verrucomicrobia bacterium]|nr:MAG: hypothetical protein DMF06_05310 [Verrucomicrobiota bacterium]